MSRAAIALALALAGCAREARAPSDPDAGPRADAGVVAVYPVTSRLPDARANAQEFGNILASEVLRFPGRRPIRPGDLVGARGGEGSPALEEVLTSARRLKAEAVLVVDITEYDPYDPPRVSVAVQFFGVDGRVLSGAELDRIVRSASWRRGPFALDAERAGRLRADFEAVYDAREDRTRRDLRAYARSSGDGNSGFSSERELLAVQSRYWRFVSNQILSRVLSAPASE